jgi:hypothetical protein
MALGAHQQREAGPRCPANAIGPSRLWPASQPVGHDTWECRSADVGPEMVPVINPTAPKSVQARNRRAPDAAGDLPGPQTTVGWGAGIPRGRRGGREREWRHPPKPTCGWCRPEAKGDADAPPQT